MTPGWRKLVQELKAIELWDNFFYLKPAHDKMALVAFQSRQSRRREILELLKREDKDGKNSLRNSVADDATPVSIGYTSPTRMD